MLSRFVLASLLLLAAPALAGAEGLSGPDDNARVLAGLPVPSSSPLAALEAEPAWSQHARAFDAAFDRVENGQLSKIRAWAKANVAAKQPTLLYFFSGPDFLYANAFFPEAETYVMAGLEPVGAVPDLAKLPRRALPQVLRSLQVSLRSVLNLSFFKTIDMRSDFRASPVSGITPVLYVFLERSGKTIKDVKRIRLGDDGEVYADSDPAEDGATQGVKITFGSPGGPTQTLYYFSANLANGGFAETGLAAFAGKLGPASAFVKSASYLLHGSNFADVRKFLLMHATSILQDDTGIPVLSFSPDWKLQPFGHYTGPISLFAGMYQPKLTALFRKDANPLGFGIGYTYQPDRSNLLLAVKR